MHIECQPTIEMGMRVDMGGGSSESNAEAWAVGERHGVPVDENDQTYHNNAKWYAENGLIVPVFTDNLGTWSCSMTFAAVLAAAQAGKCTGCIATHGDTKTGYTLQGAGSDVVTFSNAVCRTSDNTVHMNMILYISNGSIIYQESVVDPADTIDDLAGSGDTDKVWSANKLTAEFYLKAPKASPVFTGSVSMGRKSGTTVGTNSTALGLNVEASGTQSYAEGNGTKASGIYSHAEGGGTIASGVASHTEGGSTEASGGWSHAEGGSTKATNDYAHAEGSGTLASGSYSHAEGGGTKATAIGAHAEGSGSQATSANAHAEGGGTQAYGAQSHAEGGSTQATGDCSHAEGYQSVAGGFNSHAEGNRSWANGDSMHVSGSHNYIPALYASWTANTQYQVGDRVTYANGGHAYGYECITANSDSSFDSLKWEVLPYNGEFAEIVGNGKNNDTSNAYALKWDGTGLYAGDVYVHCDKFSNVGYKLISAADVATTTETQAIITEYGVSA